MILFLWWHGYDAQTFAQASFNSTLLEMVAGIGAIWSVIGAVWLAKHKKDAKNLKVRATR
jgi:hypothetical protein